jgi:hypothetical protein
MARISMLRRVNRGQQRARACRALDCRAQLRTRRDSCRCSPWDHSLCVKHHISM